MTLALKRALVLCAHGTEEMELVITVDVLRRAGVLVTMAAVDSKGDGVIECSRGVKVVADKTLADVNNEEAFDAVVLPGGAKGAKTFAESVSVHRIIQRQLASGHYVGAICAGPIALKAADVLKGANITSHPSVKSQLEDVYKYSESRVVVDGRLITSRGPGTSFEFALQLVETLLGKDKRDEISLPMILSS